jgi:hypothetical protein
LILIITSLIVTSLKKGKIDSRKNSYFRGLIFRSILVLFLLTIVGLTPRRSMITLFNRDFPEYIDALEEFMENPTEENNIELERQRNLRDEKRKEMYE